MICPWSVWDTRETPAETQFWRLCSEVFFTHNSGSQYGRQNCVLISCTEGRQWYSHRAFAGLLWDSFWLWYTAWLWCYCCSFFSANKLQICKHCHFGSCESSSAIQAYLMVIYLWRATILVTIERIKSAKEKKKTLFFYWTQWLIV